MRSFRLARSRLIESAEYAGARSARRLLWRFPLGLLAAALLLPCAARATPDATIQFLRHGEEVASRSESTLAGEVGPGTVRVHEPYEEGVIAFKAFPLREVLDTIYSPSWRHEEELLFTCSDGYQPTVPVKRVLEHHAWLAYAREDLESFTIQKKESGEVQTVDLGPYYVVWENLNDQKIRQEGDYGWPYQVVAIDLIDRRDRFAKMVPPKGSSPAVLAGFDAFRVHCSKCHKVNGEGGTIGPELNPEGGSGEYYEREFLRTWIEEPAKIRPKTRMPALNPALPNRAKVVRDIVAYLLSMSGAGAPAPES